MPPTGMPMYLSSSRVSGSVAPRLKRKVMGSPRAVREASHSGENILSAGMGNSPGWGMAKGPAKGEARARERAAPAIAVVAAMKVRRERVVRGWGPQPQEGEQQASAGVSCWCVMARRAYPMPGCRWQGEEEHGVHGGAH